jgi:hypothetical protein
MFFACKSTLIIELMNLVKVLSIQWFENNYSGLSSSKTDELSTNSNSPLSHCGQSLKYSSSIAK